MSSVSFKGDTSQLKKLATKIKKLADPITRRDFVTAIAEDHRAYMSDCFAAEHGPYGEPWAPLQWRDSFGIGAEAKAQKILRDTGTLKNGATTALNKSETGFKIVVGVVYASVHQYGAVIKAKNAKSLAFRGVTHITRAGKSGRPITKAMHWGWVFVKQVTIPARPYALVKGIPPELDARVKASFKDYMKEALG